VARYILTGAPGSGKTAILRQLELLEYSVVEESATDVIARLQALGVPEPWQDPDFLSQIVALQRYRQVRASGRPLFFDRSPVCTLALARHLGFAPPDDLRAEIARVRNEPVYATTVFFVRNQGRVEPTAARRISFEESLSFERIHEETYRELGFELVEVPAAPLLDRTAAVLNTVDLLERPGPPTPTISS
jgi:predicted ATPase